MNTAEIMAITTGLDNYATRVVTGEYQPRWEIETEAGDIKVTVTVGKRGLGWQGVPRVITGVLASWLNRRGWIIVDYKDDIQGTGVSVFSKMEGPR